MLRKLTRVHLFRIGVAAGLLIFISANVWSYRQRIHEPFLTDVPISFGFPFKLYTAHGFGGEAILWSGLIADMLVALCGSIILGLVAGLVFRNQVRFRALSLRQPGEGNCKHLENSTDRI